MKDNATKIWFKKNKLIFTALVEVCMIVLSYNLYTQAGVVTVAGIVIILLPLLYPLVSRDALAIAYFDEGGVTLKKFGKVLATRQWADSEVGVYARRSGRKYNYYVYISRPCPVLTSSDLGHILSFTLNDECVLAFLSYYSGDYVGYEGLEERHIEVFSRAKRAISTVAERQRDRDRQDSRDRTEEEKRRARERKKNGAKKGTEM